MNVITVDISSLREKLSDYLSLVGLGKTEVSVKNAKNGKEVARIVMPLAKEKKDALIEKRIKELEKLAGFAAGYSNESRRKFKKMDRDYIKKLRRGIIE